jgi:hypothetical protein
MTVDEKLSIARGIVSPLLRKIRAGTNEGERLDRIRKQGCFAFPIPLDLQCNLTGVLTHDEHVNKLDPR